MEATVFWAVAILDVLFVLALLCGEIYLYWS